MIDKSNLGIRKKYNLEKVDIVVFFVLLLLGGILRILGYNWDGGVVTFQPDEYNMVDPAIHFLNTKTLWPEFKYPAQFFSKLQAVVMWIFVRFEHATESGFEVQMYFICRIFGAVIGTATIVTIFLIGNYLRKHLGTVSAALLTVSPMMVMMAKQVTGDVTTLFLCSMVMLFALRYTEKQEMRYLVLMSVFAGAATMEKWHGGASGVLVGLFVLLYASSIVDFLKRGIIAFCTYIITIIIIAPNIVTNIRGAIDGFVGTAVWDDVEKPGYATNILAYSYHYSFLGLGIVFIALVITGVILVFKNRDKRYAVLLLGVIKALMMSVMNRTMPRWGLELYFSEIVLASLAICILFESKNHILKGLDYAATIVVVAEMTLATLFVVTISLSSSQDVRILQGKYCLANGIAKEDCVSARYTFFNPTGYIEGGIGQWVDDNGEDTFEIRAGELLKKKDYDYFVWSGRQSVSDVLELLEEKNLCIWNGEATYNDIFNIPYTLTMDRNDIKLCINYAKAIVDVKNGAKFGAFDVRIYDISGIPMND